MCALVQHSPLESGLPPGWRARVVHVPRLSEPASLTTLPYRQALALATELGMRPLVAHCHLGLGKLCGRTRDPNKADEHLTTAAAMYREMGMTFWLEKAEAELARR